MADVVTAPQKALVRGGRTKASQGKAWKKISGLIDVMIQTRPYDHISAFLAELRELNISRKDPNAFYLKRAMVTPLGEAILKGAKSDLENRFYFPNVIGQRYAPSTISATRYLMNCVRPNTTAICELGSGWSTNLFQIYVGLGATRCAKIAFHGAEYTDEGAECAEKIASHDGRIKYAAHKFDYRKPDISFLEKYEGHILVFTKHSIEQVEIISPTLYDKLHDLKANVTLIHIEPTGWQRDADLIGRRKANDEPFFQEIGERLDRDIDSARSQMENAAWWSWRLKYNMNLTAIISRNYKDKKIKVIRREYDFDGVGNVLNPSSLYHLQFVAKKPGQNWEKSLRTFDFGGGPVRAQPHAADEIEKGRYVRIREAKDGKWSGVFVYEVGADGVIRADR